MDIIFTPYEYTIIIRHIPIGIYIILYVRCHRKIGHTIVCGSHSSYYSITVNMFDILL